MKTKFNIGDVIKAKSGAIGEVQAIVVTADEVRYHFHAKSITETMGSCEAENDIVATYKAEKVRKKRMTRIKAESEISDDAG